MSDLASIEQVRTLDAIDQALVDELLEAGWTLLATGVGVAGQTTLTFGLAPGGFR